MYECTSIIINFFHLFQQTLFKKGFVVEEGGGEGGGGGPQRANEKKQGEGRSQTYLYAHSVKIAWFFKQQIEFLLIGCLAVTNSFIKKA